MARVPLSPLIMNKLFRKLGVKFLNFMRTIFRMHAPQRELFFRAKPSRHLSDGRKGLIRPQRATRNFCAILLCKSKRKRRPPTHPPSTGGGSCPPSTTDAAFPPLLSRPSYLRTSASPSLLGPTTCCTRARVTSVAAEARVVRCRSTQDTEDYQSAWHQEDALR